MIFIANVLVMNGGSTFLVRMAREYRQRGHRCAVLVLTNRCDPAVVEELENLADLFYLSDFQQDRGRIASGLLGVFAPLRRDRLLRALDPYGLHIHAMSVFGMVLVQRLVGGDANRKLTVGIYHQNEFLYRAPPFHFARRIQRMFKDVPPENVIFFNESSRANYSNFFQCGYAESSLLPIGITLEYPPEPPPPAIGQRIVSIGNLAAFKTYNRHMIEAVAALRVRFPNIRYDIYGEGPMLDELVEMTRRLDVADLVTFHGMLEYARMREVLVSCDLFVGSGTALVEAAAVGRPALIGVESMETPLTYGFLSDAQGFSYNERQDDVPLQPILPLLIELFSNHNHWKEVADACAVKSQTFSVKITADGFEQAGKRARPIDQRLSWMQLVRLGTSAFAMRISEILPRSEKFGDRRNQSY